MPGARKSYAIALFFLLMVQGCASSPAPVLAPTNGAPSSSSSIARAIGSVATSGSAWSTRTREGREALAADDYQTAEVLLFEALEISTRFRSTDVRVNVSLGNLVRLAAFYERSDRTSDALRLLSLIEELGARHPEHGITQRRVKSHQLRFAQLRLRRTPNDETEKARRQKRRKGQGSSTSFDGLIRRAATSYDVDPALVKAVVAAESNFEPRAISPVGAKGLMQLMPETARAMGVRRPFVPRENIRGGVRYLRSLLDQFDELDHALAAYNAGPDAVLRYGGIPPYPETREYVTRVRDHYRRYQDRPTR